MHTAFPFSFSGLPILLRQLQAISGTGRFRYERRKDMLTGGRKRRDRTGKSRTALILSVILLLSGLVPGCGNRMAGDFAGNGERNSSEVFDTFARDLFVELVSRDEITLNFTLADPQVYGITEAESAFGSYSMETIESGREQDKEILAALKKMREEELTEEQRLTYRILREMLKEQDAGKGLELYEEPLNSVTGTHLTLPVLLAEYRFYGKESVDTYLGLLEQIDVYYGELLDFERQKAEAGLFMSDRMADQVIAACRAYLGEVEGSQMDQSFQERLEEVPGISGEEQEAYLAENRRLLEEHFVPAYENLAEGLEALKGSGTNDLGLYYFPKGRTYYEYLVEHSIYPSYSTVNELRQAVEEQLEADLDAMYSVLYRSPELAEKFGQYSFDSEDPPVVLESLQKAMTKDFPELPESEYRIKYVPESLEESMSPAFYLVPPMDRPQENVIYINRGSGDYDTYTLLAHEGFPGHLYQHEYFRRKEAQELRYALSFSAYSEGWGTYAENCSYLFEGNGLEKGMGEVLARNSSVTKGLYALLDIRINYEGWDRKEAADFIRQLFDIDDAVADEIYDSLIADPSNYLLYYTGYLEIVRMRAEAEEALGNAFHAKEFHSFLLDMGPAPFGVIREYFEEWLEAEEKGAVGEKAA